jgi:hypothetical protein
VKAAIASASLAAAMFPVMNSMPGKSLALASSVTAVARREQRDAARTGRPGAWRRTHDRTMTYSASPATVRTDV